MNGRIISSFKWLYPRVVISSTVAGGIGNNIYFIDYINKNNVTYNMLDITIDGMLGGLVFGAISPIAIPYIGISTVYDMLVDENNEP
jgi:hypothetical protein